MQVFGGMGYVEETGVSQFYRDVRVTAIYEGTNGIQAMDMVGRKLPDGGAAAHKLIDEVMETAGEVAGDLGGRLAAAARRLTEATGWMTAAEIERPLRRGGAVPARLRVDPGRALPAQGGGGGGRRGRAAGRARRLPHPAGAAAGRGALRGRLRGRGSTLCV